MRVFVLVCFTQPPANVRMVLAAVVILLGGKPDVVTDPATGKKSEDYFGPAKRLLGENHFIDRLKSHHRSPLDPRVIATGESNALRAVCLVVLALYVAGALFGNS